MLTKLTRLRDRGDTIVEVMVVLAVLGLAIGISYATANRSLLATRGAQENSQATELLQAQIEQVRALSTVTGSAIYTTLFNRFCIDTSNLSVVAFPNSGPLTQTNTTTYPAACGPINTYYYISVSYNNADDSFTAKAYWADVQGQGLDSSTLIYRAHQ